MHFCIITLDSRREEPSWGALIAEVTVWEWLMNKAEISCFLSRALKQMSYSGNFPLSINGKAQLAREEWLWVSCREREDGSKLLESLRYSQRALKVTNGKSNQFIIPLYELWVSFLAFCYAHLLRTRWRPNGAPLTACVFKTPPFLWSVCHAQWIARLLSLFDSVPPALQTGIYSFHVHMSYFAWRTSRKGI